LINQKRVLAVIPARGGSKGVPRKNVRDLAGKPLICWTINAAKESKYIDRLILTSEDEEIIRVAKAAGCDVPFTRPEELASDTAAGVDVLCHAVEQVAEDYDYVVLLQPTSPLRQTSDIDGAVELCVDRDVASVVSVAEATKSPYWMYHMQGDGALSPFVENSAANRQELPRAYALNGAVYVLRIASLLESRKIMSEETIGYVMPEERSYDIDSETDFLICEFLKNRLEPSR
jgi:N-acylneuraminate cytidylyltransferase